MLENIFIFFEVADVYTWFSLLILIILLFLFLITDSKKLYLIYIILTVLLTLNYVFYELSLAQQDRDIWFGGIEEALKGMGFAFISTVLHIIFILWKTINALSND